MCDNLRKVTFRITPYEFNPDETPKELKEIEEQTKDREGYFHQWSSDVDTSKDLPYVKTVAIVEDADSGEVFVIDPENLQFKKNK